MSPELELALEGVADGVVVSDASRRLLYANDYVMRLLGISTLEELTRLTLGERVERFRIVLEDGTPLSLHQLPGAQALRGGASEQTLGVRRLGGGLRWVVSKSRVVKDSRGAPWLIVHHFRDITEQRRAEENTRFLADATALLGSSLEPSETLGALVDLVVPRLADFCVIDGLDAEGSLRRVAVAHRDPALATFLTDLPCLDDPTKPTRRAAHRGDTLLLSPIPREACEASPGGCPELPATFEPTSVLVVPLTVRGRGIGSLILGTTGDARLLDEVDLELAQELAGRAAMAMENARLYRTARETLASRETALAAVYHELRNGLTTILSTTSRLESGRAGASEAALVRMAADGMSRLVGDMLDLSRIEAGQVSLRLRTMPLESLIGEAFELFHCAGEAKGVAMTLVALQEPLVLECDRQRLLQVVRNLVDNAVQHTPPGGRVSLEAERGPLGARILVRDTGAGISPEHVARLFEPFWQASRASGHGSGIGLGLAIVHAIVRAHGGTIEVRPNEGGGTVVAVDLPLEQPPQSP